MIDFFATERHFIDHLAPIWKALPEGLRGGFVVHRALHEQAVINGIEEGPGDVRHPVAVASWGDYKRARKAGRDRIVYVEHGAGQSYGGDPKTHDHPGYSGGRGHEPGGLYLVPNEYSAARWRQAYPSATVRVVGCAKLETLPAREGKDGITVAVSFHWPCGVSPESGTAFSHYRPALAGLRESFEVIGHGHPRSLDAEPWLRQAYQRLGFPRVPEFSDVCRRADVYVCDNSSSLFEFAATGRPVVVLNTPAYRRDVHHGGRFWDWATVGVQVDRPDDLVAGVRLALEDRPEQRAERDRVLAEVYPVREGSAALAAQAIADWVGMPLEVAA